MIRRDKDGKMATRLITYRTESGAVAMRELAPDEPIPPGYVFQSSLGAIGDLYVPVEVDRAVRGIIDAGDDEMIDDVIRRRKS